MRAALFIKRDPGAAPLPLQSLMMPEQEFPTSNEDRQEDDNAPEDPDSEDEGD